MTTTQPIASPAPLVTVQETAALIHRLLEAMETLLTMIEEETALVREGRLRDAAALERAKADFARSYVTDMAQLAGCGAPVLQALPELMHTFRERHARFHDLLRTNMTVLATAHAVSEELIRGVSGELARKSAPQTYAASGRPAAPSASSVQPLAVSRVL